MRNEAEENGRGYVTVFVGTSWKMTKNISEARAYVRRLNAQTVWPDGVQPFIVPPHTLLDVVRTELDTSSGIWVGAQNAHWMPDGPYTGEVSMSMIKDAGASLVEIGHSERRKDFHETDETVNLKVSAAIREGLVPLVCVGENREVRDTNEAHEFVLAQVAAALNGLPEDDRSKVMIAYEPVWSIGEHGVPASADYVSSIAESVRTTHNTRSFLYGGSVTVDNARDYLGIDAVDGIFVGRSAWKADGLLSLIAEAAGHLSSESTEGRMR